MGDQAQEKTASEPSGITIDISHLNVADLLLLREQIDTRLSELGISTETAPEPTNTPKPKGYSEYSYKKAARNPETYEGTLVKVEGKVIQVVGTRKEGYTIRLATKGNYDDIILLYISSLYMPDSNILEDDTLTVYGTAQGEYTYQSTLGGEITVPLVMGTSVEIKE